MFRSWVTPLVGRHVVKHGKNLRGYLRLLGGKKMKSGVFYLLGSYPLVGRHVVNEPKIGCHVASELEVT